MKLLLCACRDRPWPSSALTAKFNKLTIKVYRPQLSPADIKKLREAMMEKAKSD